MTITANDVKKDAKVRVTAEMAYFDKGEVYSIYKDAPDGIGESGESAMVKTSNGGAMHVPFENLEVA